MRDAIWIAKKNQLCMLIKKISDHYGGEPIEDLREYAKDIIDRYSDDIQKPLDCFLELEKQLNYVPRLEVKNGQIRVIEDALWK